MEFTQIAYCCTVPFLLLFSWIGKKKNTFLLINSIAVSNLLVMGYAVFLIRQMIGLYQLGKQLQISPQGPPPPIDIAAMRLLLVMILPFLSLLKPVRNNRLFSLLLLGLLYWNNPVTYWNTYDLFTKIPVYLSAFCAGYALLWLMKQLPYQSRLQ